MTGNPDQSENSSDQPRHAPGQSVSTPEQLTRPAVAEASSPVDVSSPANDDRTQDDTDDRGTGSYL